MALRFTSGVAGVPELTSAEAFVEFEKNVSGGPHAWNPARTLGRFRRLAPPTLDEANPAITLSEVTL